MSVVDVMKVKPRVIKASYFLINFPGQVELHTHQKLLHLKLCTVNMIDCV